MQASLQFAHVALPPGAGTLRAEVRVFLAEHQDSWSARSVAQSWVGFDRSFTLAVGARGWIGMTWPDNPYSGSQRPAIDRLIVGEEMIKAGAPIAASWFGDRQMGPALLSYGTPDQQEEFLPGILAGETTWCIGMSEPNSGSDLASLQTRAVRDGDDFVIDGQKIWTSFAAVADYCYLICRTSTDGPPHAGISEIIVPMDTPGIEVRPITDMTTKAQNRSSIGLPSFEIRAGNHGTAQNTIDDRKVITMK